MEAENNTPDAIKSAIAEIGHEIEEAGEKELHLHDDAAKMAKPLVGHHFVDDTTVFMGRTINQPVYTVVFGILAIVTIVEVALSGLPRGFFTIPLMLGLALIKAGLVVWFYMHLNKDNRIFLFTLLIPFIMMILAIGFLLIVPTGY